MPVDLAFIFAAWQRGTGRKCLKMNESVKRAEIYSRTVPILNHEWTPMNTN
jgi:hypothetical protein